MTRLERFFKDNDHRLGYPHPLPHMGRGADLKLSFAGKDFCAFSRLVASPTSVGLWLARLVLFDVEAALAKTSLSPVAHATNGFTHGRVWFFCEEVYF